MERSYTDELNPAYDDFFSKPLDQPPLLTIDTHDLNIVQNPEHMKMMENRIKQSLSLPPFQQALPLPN
jgi:deoxyadenosine/deoxycytidine kinase